ncbi:MAG: HAD-IC family P-type ATPase, partial [Deltaproteobacteria bacterium]
MNGRNEAKHAPERKEGSGRQEAAELKKLSIEEALKRFKTSTDGLSREEASRRLDEYGYNEIEEERESALAQFLSYFRGTIPYMIMAAALVSGILGNYITLVIIVLLLFVNAFIGFREERQAGDAIEALKKRLAVQANVKREGKWSGIEARELVPGDIIRLRIGNVIPADAKLLQGEAVKVDESALTGESMPVTHEAGDTVYSGSVLRQGEIDAVIYGTGANTFYGKTAQLVESAATKSHLQIAIMKMADYLLVIGVVLAVLIVSVIISRQGGILEAVQFVLVLIVASVPVAMPAVLSITMALGADKLAEKKAIVTKLSSVEEVAGVDVLCSDKTGTLTQAKLTPGDPFTVEGIDAGEVIFSGALASREEDQDPIDLAVLSGVQDKDKLKSYSIEHFSPFDPVHKRTEAQVKGPDGKVFKTTKGAPQVILDLDPNAAEIKAEVDKAVNGFAGRGFRSLGVACSEEEGRWRFIGVIPLYDPVREDSKSTIDTAKKLGLKIKMVTGDLVA